MAKFALDAGNVFHAIGAVLPKPAYSDKVDEKLGYKPKKKDSDDNVIQARDDNDVLLWTVDIAPADEDKALPITVTVAAPHQPVLKRFSEVVMRHPYLNVYARGDGNRAQLGLSITCEEIHTKGAPSSVPPPATNKAA